MNTLNQIAQDILSIVRAKRVDDYIVTAAQVKRWINYKRSVFVKQELNKKGPIDEDYIQDLGCVDLVKVPNGECGDQCLVLRTCKKIPSPVSIGTGLLAITRVGPVKKTSRAYSFVDSSQISWSGNGRFSKGNIYAYYMNGYMYLEISNANPLSRNLKKINIRGVFENPDAAADFTECNGTSCYDNNTPYPIKEWMIDGIINSILEERFGIIERSIVDTKNDEADATEI